MFSHRLIWPFLIPGSQTVPGSIALFIGTQDFFHLPALGQLVDQLIQIPTFLNEWVFQLFDSVPTDDALNEVRIRIQSALFEKGIKGYFVVDQGFQIFFIVASKLRDDFVQLFFGSALLFNF